MQPVNVLSSLAPSVFALYMMVGSNFLPQLFGCRLQTLLNSSMAAKHALGMLLAFFLIVLVNPAFADQNIGGAMLVTLGIYAWFIMTTRCPFSVTLVTLVLLLAIYVLGIKKDKANANNDAQSADRYRRSQMVLVILAVVVSVVGFGVYAMEKKMEYKETFDFMTFVVGKTECRNATPAEARILG